MVSYIPYSEFLRERLQEFFTFRSLGVADGALRRVYDARTGLGVTSPIAWSPDATRFAYGTYEGTAVVARTPAP